MENRVFERISCEVPASFLNLVVGENSSPQEETSVRDISEGGIRFRLNQFVPIQNFLIVRLNLFKTKSIEATVKPVWIREMPHLEQYEFGASFVSLSREDKLKLREYLTQNSHSY